MSIEGYPVRPTRFEGGYWPTPKQNLLLKASLLKGEEALGAWREWKSGVDIDEIDYGSQRLLPLLYKNLYAHGVKDPLMERFKGVYRRTWYANHLIFHGMARLLSSFNDAGVRTMILKGGALILHYYKDHGLRPMADFDVLVPTEQALSTVKLLDEEDWAPVGRPLDMFTETYLGITQAHPFTNANGLSLDLHWHVLYECCYPDADDDFWEGAVATAINDVATHTLNPTDHLLHVCIHGAKWCPTPSIRWVSDAMFILNNSEIDWGRLADQAEKRRLTLALGAALNYLRLVLKAPVPRSFLEDIRDTSVSRIERTEFEARGRPQLLSDFQRGPLQALWNFRFRYRWLMHCEDSPETFSGFLKYLQHFFGVARLWQLPPFLFHKLILRIMKKLNYNMSRLGNFFSE